MSEKISIRIPKVVVTPGEFAALENLSRSAVYSRIHRGALAKFLKNKEKNKSWVEIYYLRYKKDQLSKALGHSRFEIIVDELVSC